MLSDEVPDILSQNCITDKKTMEGGVFIYRVLRNGEGTKKMYEWVGAMRQGLRVSLNMDEYFFYFLSQFHVSSILGMMYTVCREGHKCLSGIIPFFL